MIKIVGGGKLYLLPQYKVVKWKRICERWKKITLIYVLCWLYYSHLQNKFGVDIPVQTKIGDGFLIEHCGGIVMNPKVSIGRNCNVYNGVTIGKEKRGLREGNPVIGDQVWIGANAVIVGKIKVGNDVMIAPGAFVNFDVPDHSIVLGNPARIIHKENATEGYIKNLV